MRNAIRLSVLVFAFVLLHVSASQSGTTELVSVASDGTQSNHHSVSPSADADGRYVAFSSQATNLVPNDTNGKEDIFVRDRVSGTTERVSVDSSGTQGNGRSFFPSISADGRYVAFSSQATNLVLNDTNGKFDIFVRDRVNGTTEIVSVDIGGVQIFDHSTHASISNDGRFVAFESHDVFVKDRLTGATEQVNVDSSGVAANGQSQALEISGNGQFVAFTSFATNLVPNDNNAVPGVPNSGVDVFVHDRQTGVTVRVNVDSSGNEANGNSETVSINENGQIVAFSSLADNLVPLDKDPNVIQRNVYVHDLATGVTEIVSISSLGNQGPGSSSLPSLSADGRFVAFSSQARHFIPDDAGVPDANRNASDVFVHDRQTGVTELVSMASDGTQGNLFSDAPSLSADGQVVVFKSNASNLVSVDTNPLFSDLFAHNRSAEPMVLVAPDTVDFGQVNAFNSQDTILTISSIGGADLTVNDVAVTVGASNFSVSDIDPSGPPPFTLVSGDHVFVTITFFPTGEGIHQGTLTADSDDPDDPIVEVNLVGNGLVGAVEEQATVLEAAVDDAIAFGGLVGSGSGNSSIGRLNAFANMIEVAGDLIEAGFIEDACGQLRSALRRVDGDPRPPDFATEDDAGLIADQIVFLRDSLGCS